MKLYSIEYTEFGEETFAWVLNELALIDINLIVGKNATGKSRVLRVIYGLAQLIEGTRSPSSLISGHYKAIFTQSSNSEFNQVPNITYSLQIHAGAVTQESLFVGNDEKLSRGLDGRGKIYFEKNNAHIDVQIPQNLLAASSRRDSQQHSYFEYLHSWAKTVKLFEFNKTQTNEATSFEGKLTLDAIEKGQLQNHLHATIKLGKEHFRRDFTSPILRDMKKIGYNLSDFGLTPVVGLASNIKFSNSLDTLYITEDGIDKKIMQNELSDGMLRALATLVHLHFIMLQKKFGCVLIDDIGEGLDFDRATKLISVVIELAEKSFFQLIMTTNDRFVMNNVSLDYWTILQRDFGKIQVFNKRNANNIFTDFEEYGFNNFDLFAKGFFLNSKLETNK